ncbi:MAG: hypothetical protein PHR78_01120 [Eubacteriales bacterium]|nr:hypothetical protein [Eubacteriales bacterium]MDD4323608.1 hypothetical protein [Eubacteriales bacterium]MDD4540758.1 hypothetical protein [Eubacteriales bacterium]
MKKSHIPTLLLALILILLLGLIACKEESTIYGTWQITGGAALDEAAAGNFDELKLVITEHDNSMKYVLADPDSASQEAQLVLLLLEPLTLSIDKLTESTFIMVGEMDGTINRNVIEYRIEGEHMVWIDETGAELNFAR